MSTLPAADQRPDGDGAGDGAGEARTWAERDAAVVWHGFTQMAAYTGNAPLVIERAEGRELIDADGRRYLDAISSLWVNTLGHCVPELDAALAAQAGKVAHTTMLGNGNTVVVELAEALAPVVPVDDPHFLFAADGAVAVEQVAVQSGGQLQQVTDLSRLGQSRAAKVIVELDVLIECPGEVGDTAEEGRALAEGRLYIRLLEHGLERLAHEMGSGVFGRIEELQRSHMHGMFPGLTDKEHRIDW